MLFNNLKEAVELRQTYLNGLRSYYAATGIPPKDKVNCLFPLENE